MTSRTPSSRLAFLFFLQAVAASIALGQSPLNPPPDASTPSGPTPNPTPAAANGQGDDLVIPNGTVQTILQYYERLSGKHLVLDSALTGGGQPVANMSINAPNVSKAEALKIIEATLLLNGVAIVPIDDTTVKVVVTQSQGKNPRTEGVQVYTNAADLPVLDQVVNYYMPLSYVSAQEAQTIFQNAVPPHAYGMYTPAPSAQALVISENVSNIRRLISLKELIDVPPARVISEFVPLNRSDAEKVAELLNRLLDQPSGAPGAGGAPNPALAASAGGVIVPASLGTNAPLSNERNLLSGAAKIIPDPRTNSIVIVTRPVNMPFLRQLITQLDQTDVTLTPQRRPLKYVLAQDILPALEASLAQGKDEQDQVKNDATKAAGNTTSQPGGGGGGNSGRSSNNSLGSLNSGGSSGGGATGAVTADLQAPTQNNVPTVVTIGKTRIMADNRSNSIIVFGSPDIVSRIYDMIDQLDRKPLQVYLATVIGQLTVSDGQEFGIDIIQKFSGRRTGVATGLFSPGSVTANAANGSGTATSVVPEPSSLLTAAGFPLMTGLTSYVAIGNTLAAYVRALGTTNRFKVISRPCVYTTNNKLAVIASGQQIPIPGTTVSGFNNGNDLTTSSTTTYESVLLQLQIIPLINANHEVTLQVRQTNNSAGTPQNISGNEVPIILTQEINTEVTVPDRSTIVIGGLISDNVNRKTSGVPWLSDIPLLGYLFKDTSKSKERDELIIMIQPTVVETDLDQVAANETEKQRTILGREAVDAANVTVDEKGRPITKAKVTEKSATVQTTVHNSKGGVVSRTTTVSPASAAQAAGPLIKPHTGSIVPEVSSPAPDVSNGKLPPNPTTSKAEETKP